MALRVSMFVFGSQSNQHATHNLSWQAIDKFFPLIVECEEEGNQESPIIVCDDFTFVYIKYKNVYSMCTCSSLPCAQAPSAACLFSPMNTRLAHSLPGGMAFMTPPMRRLRFLGLSQALACADGYVACFFSPLLCSPHTCARFCSCRHDPEKCQRCPHYRLHAQDGAGKGLAFASRSVHAWTSFAELASP